jgi:hypothetical protein
MEPGVIDLSAPSDFTSLDSILDAAGFHAGGPSPWGHSFWQRAGKCAYDGIMLRRQGFEPTTSKALNAGILFHECLALRSLVLTGRHAPVPYTSPALAVIEWAKNNPSDWAKNLYAWAMEVIDWVTEYDASWQLPPPGTEPTIQNLQRYDFPVDTVGPVEIMLQVNEPFPWSMKADKMVFMKTPHGKWSVLSPDIKTSSNAERLIRTYWQESQSMGTLHTWSRLRGTVHNGVQLPDLPMDYFALDILEKGKSPVLRREFFPNRPERIALFEESGKRAWETFRGHMDAVGISEDHPSYVPDEDVHREVPLEGIINGNCHWGPRQECPRVDHCLRLTAAPRPHKVQVPPTWDLVPTTPLPPSAASVPPPDEPVSSPVGPADVVEGAAAGVEKAPDPEVTTNMGDSPTEDPIGPEPKDAPPPASEPPPGVERGEGGGQGTERPFEVLIARVDADPRVKSWAGVVEWMKTSTLPELEDFVQTKGLVLAPEDLGTVVRAQDALALVLLGRMGPQLPPPGQWAIQEFLSDQPVPVATLEVGCPVHTRGGIFWVTGSFQEGSGRAVLVGQSGAELALPTVGDDSLVMPVALRRTDVTKTTKEPPTPDPTPTGIEQGAIIDEILGDAGPVPLYWLGSWGSGGKRLEKMLQGCCAATDDRAEIPEAYGVALVGRNPDKRKIQVKHVQEGVPQETTSKILGKDTWGLIGRLVDEHVRGEKGKETDQ